MRPVVARRLRLGIAIFACVFGVLTLIGGGTALFGGAEAKAAAGNVVDFVLWFNFCAGFAYITAGAGLFLNKGWAIALARLIALASIVVWAGLIFHIISGHPYEARTLIAMSARTVIWVAIALFAPKTN